MQNQPFIKLPYFHFVLLAVVVILMYGNTLGLGFFSDDFQGIERYSQMGLGGFSENYQNPFFMPLSFLFQALELQFFGSSYSALKVINLLLFTGTAVQLYLLSSKLISRVELDNGLIAFTPLFIALLFVLSPYQTEAINWFASQAYILASFFSLWALNLYIRYRDSKNNRYLYGYIIVLFAALLNKEIALILPIISLVLGSVLFADKHQLGKRIALTWGAVAVYFVLRFFYLGNLIGGYGADAHLNMKFDLLLFGVVAYVSKFFLLYRYIPQEAKTALIVLIPLLLVLLASFSIWKKRTFEKRHLLLFALFAAFTASLLPVLNLETSFLGEIQSDRYGYFPSVFFSLFIGLFFAVFAQRTLVFIAIPILLLFSYLTFQTNQKWIAAAKVRDNFIESIGDLTHSRTNILLNLPDTYDGIYLFRHGFDECIGFETTKNIRTPYSHALTPNNSIIHETMDDGTIRVQIYNGRISPLTEENVTMLESSDGYTLLIDAQIASNNSIYYFDNKRLVRVN